MFNQNLIKGREPAEKELGRIKTGLNPGFLADVVIMVAVLLICSGQAVGLSDPINQSLTEFNNLTKADNVLEVAQEMNSWVGGGFGIMIIMIMFGITFGVTMFYTQAISRALVLGFFIELITCILLRIVSLVPDVALYYSFPLFLLSIVFAVVVKGR